MNQHLPAATARQVIAALQRVGFHAKRVTGSHYILFHPSDPRRAVTVPYHDIIRQAGMTIDAFRDLL